MSKISSLFNRKSHPTFSLILFGLTVFLLNLIATSTSTSAISQTELLQKTLLNALPTCYQGSTYLISDGITGSEFQNLGIDLLLTSDGKNNKIINVPNELGNSLSDSKITCQGVFDGTTRHTGFLWLNKESMPGLLELYGKSDSNIEDFGYVPAQSETNKQGCISFKYTAPNASGRSENHETNSVCFKLDDNGDIDTSTYDTVTTNEDGTGGPVKLYFDSSMLSLNSWIEDAVNAQTSAQLGYTSGKSWDEFVQEVSSTLAGTSSWSNGYSPINDARRWDPQQNTEVSMGLFYQNTDSDITNGQVFGSYEKGSDAALQAIRYFTGNSSATLDSIKFTDSETYDLYEAYFERMLADGKVFVDSDCYSSKDQVERTYKYYDPEINQWCGVQISSTADPDETYNVVNNSRNGLMPMSLKNVLQSMTNWDFYYAEDPNNPGGSSNPNIEGVVDDGVNDQEGAGSTLAACYQAAGVLGWIMCPVTEAIGFATAGIYSLIVEDFLAVSPNLLGDGTESAWAIFRNITNIIFAIFFVLIILSQVTGIGLSNYGIKKTLPRLIMVVILVNISFILCQLAVDVSNILGSGFNSIFSNLANQVAAGSTAFDFSNALTGIITYLVGGTGIAGAVGGTAGVIYVAGKVLTLSALNWSYWLIPLVLALFALIAGIFFFFLLLGVRKAGIIILIVLAPVAIICYSLPNTKKLFDRWLKIFSALLILYPICGLLMGGGKFASTIILSTAADGDTGFILTLVAMLLTVVPFFFIPSLLRSSMTAMGNLGAKISGFGTRFSRGVTGAVRRSEGVREWTKRNQIRAADRRADKILADAKKSGRKLSAYQMRRIALAKAAGERQELEDAANANYIKRTPEQRAAALAAQEDKFQQQQVEEEVSKIRTGGAVYTAADGTEKTVNATDIDSLSSAYDQSIKTYLNTGSETDLLRAKALQRLLMNNGDKGQTSLLQTLDRAAYKSIADRNSAHGALLKQLYSSLARDGKWMSQVKRTDAGSFARINDAASDKEGLSGIKDMSSYIEQSMNKITSEGLPDISDYALEQIKNSIDAGHFDVGSGHEEVLTNFNQKIQQSMANPQISTRFKNDDTLQGINDIHEAEYGNRRKEFVDAAVAAGATRAQAEKDFVEQYGESQKYTAGSNEFKVFHTKAAMPSGWHRATANDITRSQFNNNGSAPGFAEGDWVMTNAAGNIVKLNEGDIRRAEAIEKQNIDADIKNSLNKQQ